MKVNNKIFIFNLNSYLNNERNMLTSQTPRKRPTTSTRRIMNAAKGSYSSALNRFPMIRYTSINTYRQNKMCIRKSVRKKNSNISASKYVGRNNRKKCIINSTTRKKKVCKQFFGRKNSKSCSRNSTSRMNKKVTASKSFS